MNEFLAMGGYGFYVWGAYGVTALILALEIASVRARRRRALLEARLGGYEGSEHAIPASEPAR